MTTTPVLDPEALWQRLQRFPPAAGYCVAYSGGRDSHVLLHLMAALRGRLPGRLRAVHVNHGLQRDADAWTAHCRRVCAGLGVPLTEIAVAVAAAGGSLEDAARQARYQAFTDTLAAGEALVVAHHRDDQAETVLLRLLRGAGVHGLAAMPAERPLGAGRLLRPLLDVPATALAAYARAQDLGWIDDPSNADTRFDRNFLRHEVRPLLARRWPGHDATFARAAEQAREAAALADALAELDSAACAADDGLDAAALQALPTLRQHNLVRYWLRRRGVRPPSRERLARGLQALLTAGADRNPALAWDGLRLRRYRGRLLLVREPPALPAKPLAWDLARPLALPDGELAVEPALGEGLRADLRERTVEVGFRAGGERCRPAGRAHRQSLKKLLQEYDVPPWERPRLPLIRVDGVLAAVADLWVCEGFRAAPGEPGLRLVWRRRVVRESPFC